MKLDGRLEFLISFQKTGADTPVTKLDVLVTGVSVGDAWLEGSGC